MFQKLVYIFQCSSKKRDNPERGRKPEISQSTTVSYASVKKEITPRGDGNINKCVFRVQYIVKKEITPRGDGNFKKLAYKIFFEPVKKEITPRGDGNKDLRGRTGI